MSVYFWGRLVVGVIVVVVMVVDFFWGDDWLIDDQRGKACWLLVTVINNPSQANFCAVGGYLGEHNTVHPCCNFLPFAIKYNKKEVIWKKLPLLYNNCWPRVWLISVANKHYINEKKRRVGSWMNYSIPGTWTFVELFFSSWKARKPAKSAPPMMKKLRPNHYVPLKLWWNYVFTLKI